MNIVWHSRPSLDDRGSLSFAQNIASDDRLDAMAPGLGVSVDGVHRFYPMSVLKQPIEDEIAGKAVHVFMGALDGTPHAQFHDGTEPMQLMTRWYGFAYTYPGCELYEA